MAVSIITVDFLGTFLLTCNRWSKFLGLAAVKVFFFTKVLIENTYI
jgi:hypothetical protein